MVINFKRRAATAALLALLLAGASVGPASADQLEPGSIALSTQADDVEPAPNEADPGLPAEDQEVADPALPQEEEVGDDAAGVSDQADLDTPGEPGAVDPAAGLEEEEEVPAEEEVETPAAQEFDIVGIEVNGFPQVGETLDAAVEFTLEPDYAEYQWFADDEPIEGEDGLSLALTEEFVGMTIVFGVYAERDDLEEALEAYSDDIGPVLPAETNGEEFEILSLSISGTAKVGQTLTSAVTFSHEPDLVGYLWFADDELVEDAETDTLVLTKDMIGKTIVLGVYALNYDFEEPAVEISNEIGPVEAAAVVTDNSEVTKPAPKPAPSLPTGTLANTGADTTGALIAGVSLLLLGSGAVLTRRRVAQN